MNDSQEYVPHKSSASSLLAGMLIGGLAGAAAVLLLAPQSGDETRKQIRQKSIELRDRTTGMVEDSIDQIRSGAKRITSDGREKLLELKHQGQEIAGEQLDRVSDAALAGKKAIQNK
jgi:gas vesicle protein